MSLEHASPGPASVWSTPDLDEALVLAAPVIDVAEIRRYPEGLWMLDFEDGLVVQVQPDPSRGVLVLTAALGAARQGTEREAWRLLLELGAWWSVTGGLRMALDPGGDTVLQLDELPLQALDTARLQVGLLRFVERARAVREALAQLAPQEGSMPSRPDLAAGATASGFPALAPDLRA